MKVRRDFLGKIFHTKSGKTYLIYLNYSHQIILMYSEIDRISMTKANFIDFTYHKDYSSSKHSKMPGPLGIKTQKISPDSCIQKILNNVTLCLVSKT